MSSTSSEGSPQCPRQDLTFSVSWLLLHPPCPTKLSYERNPSFPPNNEHNNGQRNCNDPKQPEVLRHRDMVRRLVLQAHELASKDGSDGAERRKEEHRYCDRLHTLVFGFHH